MTTSSGSIHRRFNPLLGEWIIVSPNRLNRPWQGETSKVAEKQAIVDRNEVKSATDNPLQPGVTRPSGVTNDDYESTFVFTNDYPALVPEQPYGEFMEFGEDDKDLFKSEQVFGTCRVMCFHPRSDVQLATMDVAQLKDVVMAWSEQLNELGKKWAWVQIFENKGALVGCSNPHPHCQIWCTDVLPTQVMKMQKNQLQYFEKKKSPLLVDYVQKELAKGKRIVAQNEHWVVLVPFWAMWPFETMLVPKRHLLRLNDLTHAEVDSLASIMKVLLVKYDNLFESTFPYSMGWYGAPCGPFIGENFQHWQLHAVYFPPLVRSATVKKFLAGFEMLAEPQRDFTPEDAAFRLQNAGDVHYSVVNN